MEKRRLSHARPLVRRGRLATSHSFTRTVERRGFILSNFNRANTKAHYLPTCTTMHGIQRTSAPHRHGATQTTVLLKKSQLVSIHLMQSALSLDRRPRVQHTSTNTESEVHMCTEKLLRSLTRVATVQPNCNNAKEANKQHPHTTDAFRAPACHLGTQVMSFRNKLIASPMSANASSNSAGTCLWQIPASINSATCTPRPT